MWGTQSLSNVNPKINKSAAETKFWKEYILEQVGTAFVVA